MAVIKSNTEKVKLLLCLFRLTLCHYGCH